MYVLLIRCHVIFAVFLCIFSVFCLLHGFCLSKWSAASSGAPPEHFYSNEVSTMRSHGSERSIRPRESRVVERRSLLRWHNGLPRAFCDGRQLRRRRGAHRLLRTARARPRAALATRDAAEQRRRRRLARLRDRAADERVGDGVIIIGLSHLWCGLAWVFQSEDQAAPEHCSTPTPLPPRTAAILL